MYYCSTRIREGLLNVAIQDNLVDAQLEKSKMENGRSVIKTKGAIILLVFFGLFLAASLLIPSPMFPGNVLCKLVGGVTFENIRYFSALFNGIVYGGTLWLLFIGLSRRLTQEKKTKTTKRA